MDEYSKLVGEYVPGVVTGKPLGAGGSLGRTEATGYGVTFCIREAVKHLKIDPKSATAAVQGFGNVAQYATIGFTEILGGKVVCVSCWDNKDKKAYTFSKKSGVDGRFLLTIVDQYGTIDKDAAKKAGYEIEPGDAWLAKDVDVLIPAALEGQITGENVGTISKTVKLVAEGANGPVTIDADKEFQKRGLLDIPDFLCNSGGVTTSYFESVQNDMNYYWPTEEVLSKLDQKISTAFHAVLDMSLKEKVYMRDAAYLVAIDRVVKAMQFRGSI